MAPNPTVISAPGKVLLTGGYLVLDQAYQGLVVGTTARFYTAIQTGSASHVIQVQSPQFDNGQWSYNVQCKDGFQFSPTPGSSNKFVETCLRFSLAIIHHILGTDALEAILDQGLTITIVGDNDFYSQQAQLAAKNLPKTVQALASLDPFCPTSATLQTVHKTGLGSSAALTASLVAALFVHTGTASLDQQRTLIHNVAQFVHCFAQGKVGSGFDVSAAVWGNHHYVRFNPAVLTPIMNEQVEASTLVQALSPDNSSWDNKVVPFQLPPGFELILGDVDAGSHTPTLVSKVLAWRKANPTQANALWDDLGAANARVEQDLRDLHAAAASTPVEYQAAVKKFAALKASQWTAAADSPVAKQLVQLVQNFGQVRAYLQDMSRLSDVPIEPVEQTRLLDACMDVPGVVMAGVPGAGGYDAIFCIVLSHTAKQAVYDVWTSWKEMNVGPLLAQADDKGMTQLSIDKVPGLAPLLSSH